MPYRTASSGRPGLREKKAALTRLGLLDALVGRLRRKSFEAISVQELCSQVNISVPTFFNHFGSKHELLILYIRLWSIHAQRLMQAEDRSTRSALARLYDTVTSVLEENPRLVRGIFSHVVRQTVPATTGAPTRAEIAIRYPDLEPAGTRPLPMAEIIRLALERAVDRGEVASSADVRKAAAVLTGLLFGVPGLHGGTPAAREIYREGLDMVWRAMGGKGSRS